MTTGDGGSARQRITDRLLGRPADAYARANFDFRDMHRAASEALGDAIYSPNCNEFDKLTEAETLINRMLHMAQDSKQEQLCYAMNAAVYAIRNEARKMCKMRGDSVPGAEYDGIL